LFLLVHFLSDHLVPLPYVDSLLACGGLFFDLGLRGLA
jgi:hypothetical protein